MRIWVGSCEGRGRVWPGAWRSAIRRFRHQRWAVQSLFDISWIVARLQGCKVWRAEQQFGCCYSAVARIRCFFVFIRDLDGCEEVLTELSLKDPVDLCFHHTAFLIRLYGGSVLKQPFADHESLDFFCGARNKFIGWVWTT